MGLLHSTAPLSLLAGSSLHVTLVTKLCERITAHMEWLASYVVNELCHYNTESKTEIPQTDDWSFHRECLQ